MMSIGNSTFDTLGSTNSYPNESYVDLLATECFHGGRPSRVSRSWIADRLKFRLCKLSVVSFRKFATEENRSVERTEIHLLNASRSSVFGKSRRPRDACLAPNPVLAIGQNDEIRHHNAALLMPNPAFTKQN